MFHNILVAVDGSADADQALAQAIDLAESEHTHLTLITVVEPVPWGAYPGPGAPVSELSEDLLADGQAILERAGKRVPADLHVTTLLSDQPIRSALVRQVTDGRHDLTVTGSRGCGEARSALLGSVSHHVLDHSPVPVVIAHARQRQVVDSAATTVGVAQRPTPNQNEQEPHDLHAH
jgi:nucleotide-binding universal stress UspA family protein